MGVCGRRLLYGGSVLRIVDNFGAIDSSSVLSIVNNSGAINGGADDSGAINGGADDSSTDCAVWLVQCVLGKQWRVLPRVQGILRPLPSVHMVRSASSLREPEALRTQSESRHVHAVQLLRAERP